MKKLLWLFLLFPGVAFGQGARFDGVAQRTIQNFLAPIPGALITVCTSAGTGTPCTPLASIFLDAGLTQPASNPFTADSNGNFGFWAAASTTYKYSITATGVTGQLFTVVLPMVGGGAGTFSSINSDVWVCNTSLVYSNQTLAAGVTAVPATGGNIYICPGHAETISAQVATAKNVTIYVPDSAVFTAASAIGASPAIKFTGVGKVICGNSSRDTNGNVSNGALFVAGSGFTNYLMEFSTTTHFSKIQNSMVQGCMFDGNSGAANAIHVSNGFGVTIRDVYILNPIWGITFENTNSLFTEGSNIDNVYINLLSGSTGCIRHVLNGGTVSFDNAKWRRVYCNMGVNNSIAWQQPATATFGNSSVEGFKLWFAGTMTGGVGLSLAGSSPGAVVMDLVCENQTANAQTCVSSSAATPAPMFIDRGMAGSPIPTNTDGPGWSPSGTRTDNGLVGGAPFLASANNTPGTPTYAFVGGAGFSDAGMYSSGSGNVAFSVAGLRREFIGANVFSFEPAGDGNRRVQIDSTGLTLPTVSGFSTPLQLVEGASGSNVFANQDACFGDSTLHGMVCNFNNTTLTGPVKAVALTADWTCGTGGTVASCTSATIIGSGGGVPLTFALPLSAGSYTLECDGVVGQATAATANQWNLLTATNGATNVTANYSMATAATVSAYGAVTDQASTTTTFNIAPAWTLGGTGTKMPFHIWAKIEGASTSGTVVSLQLLAPTVGDLVTIFRGSACRIF